MREEITCSNSLKKTAYAKRVALVQAKYKVPQAILEGSADGIAPSFERSAL